VNTNSSGDSSWTAKFGTTSASTDIKVSEQQKDGYAFASGKCTVTHLDGTTASTNLTSANAQTVAGVKAGDQVDCTYTNKLSKAKLTLVKKVNNQYGGTATASDFTLTAAGKDTVTGKGDSDAVKDQSVTPGEYTLSESGGGAGYVQDGAWICDNATVSNSEVNLTAGSDVTCTVTNKDVPAKLTLKKVVKGGTAAPGDFTLTAKGSKDTVAGAGNSSAVTGKNVSIGAYTLSESGGPTGYEQDGAWDCGSATMSDTTVTLKPGDDVTCTVTNVAKQGAVTWKKEDGSGNALTGSEWTLTPPSGSDVTVADCVADSAAACDGPDDRSGLGTVRPGRVQGAGRLRPGFHDEAQVHRGREEPEPGSRQHQERTGQGRHAAADRRNGNRHLRHLRRGPFGRWRGRRDDLRHPSQAPYARLRPSRTPWRGRPYRPRQGNHSHFTCNRFHSYGRLTVIDLPEGNP
jgi:uncharacterized cupredoxin-like copper-binding protein